jgi:hypothetical protein
VKGGRAQLPGDASQSVPFVHAAAEDDERHPSPQALPLPRNSGRPASPVDDECVFLSSFLSFYARKLIYFLVNRLCDNHFMKNPSFLPSFHEKHTLTNISSGKTDFL